MTTSITTSITEVLAITNIRTQSLAELTFLDVCDCQHFDDTGDDDGCDVDFDDTGDDGGCDDDVADTGGDDGGQIVDVDQHQLNGGSGTHSYGGNNEDDKGRFQIIKMEI